MCVDLNEGTDRDVKLFEYLDWIERCYINTVLLQLLLLLLCMIIATNIFWSKSSQKCLYFAISWHWLINDSFLHSIMSKLWGQISATKCRFFFFFKFLLLLCWLTCGQRPSDLALFSISWIVFFLESGSCLETNTGWRQRTNPARKGKQI